MNRKYLSLLLILLALLTEYANNQISTDAPIGQFDNNNYKLCKDICYNRFTLTGENLCWENYDDEYIYLKTVHLFFYNKGSGSNFNFILYKNLQDEVYHHMFNEIINSDNGSIYSISRFLTKKFGVLFTDDFISKLQSNSDFELKNENQNLKKYELWENDSFLFWLDKLSKNPIQYDSIKEEIIYFIEIPNTPLEPLNLILEKNNYEYRFLFITEANFSSVKISKETNKLFNLLLFSTNISGKNKCL